MRRVGKDEGRKERNAGKCSKFNVKENQNFPSASNVLNRICHEKIYICKVLSTLFLESSPEALNLLSKFLTHFHICFCKHMCMDLQKESFPL